MREQTALDAQQAVPGALAVGPSGAKWSWQLREDEHPGQPVTLYTNAPLGPTQVVLPSFAPQRLPAGFAALPLAEHRPPSVSSDGTVYFAGGETLWRWAPSADSWPAALSSNYPGLIDAALRPDEVVLYALRGRQVIAVSPATLAEQTSPQPGRTRSLPRPEALLALIAAPFVGYPIFLMTCLCFALFASAFNLLIGFTGLLSFGHAMFFGFAAYVSAHAAKVWGLTPELAVLAGTLSATGIGIVTGWLAVRRQGIYFAMVTLALAQMVYFICVQAPFTYAEDGIQSVPRGKLLGLLDLADDRAMYYFVLAIAVAGFALIHRIIHSPFGQVLKSIRENEARALSLGYNVDRYKLMAFVLSATLAGMAGASKSLALGLATLTDVSWQMSGEVVLMTLLGGMGTVLGPALGASIIITMQNYLADLGSWVTIIMGATFVVCVLVFRRGIVGEIEHRLLKKH